jgi:hypothetical protein
VDGINVVDAVVVAAVVNVGVVDDVRVVPQCCRCVNPMTMHQSSWTTPHDSLSSTTGTSPTRRHRRSRLAGLGGGGRQQRQRIFH